MSNSKKEDIDMIVEKSICGVDGDIRFITQKNHAEFSGKDTWHSR